MEAKIMKKIIPLCIVVMFICCGLGAAAQSNEENKLEKVTFSFSQPTITNENEYVSISSGETNSFLMEQGKPMLPSYSETFTFPFGTKINSVTVTPQNIQMQTIPKELTPTPQMVVAGQDAKTNGVGTKNYGTEPYPSSWFEYSVGCGRSNGVISIIVDVQIYPIKYHPTEKIIEWAHEAYVVVDYEPSLSTPQPVSRDSYQLVVIGPAEYSAQIAPLITHKIGRGVTSKFVSLTEIYGGTYFPATGRDNQEKIKYFIKNAIESWTTGNILLVGGSSKVPVRETHVFIADDPEYGDEVFVSDLYYADIYNGTGGFSSWDTNTNNIFGEFNWQGQTDAVDLHPDVYLTRLPATSTSQVTACVNKIKTYENTPGYQQSWFPNLVVAGGDSFEDTSLIDEGEYSNQKVIDLMTGFIPNKLWVTNGKLTGIVPTGVANIKSAINAGCGFVDFSGHGNTNIWASHDHNNFVTWVPTPYPPGGIRSTDVQSLSNGNKLPIVTVEACSTAKFASDANCFNWAFLYNSNGGAIGTFGATGIGYSYMGTGVTTGLIGKMGLDTYKSYKLDQATTFGELWSRALNRYIKTGMTDADYKSVEEWQAFGDPTLAIGEKSQPPAKPATPSGPASGGVNTEYTYTSSTTDPDGDTISYMFDWGDNTSSSWVGPLNSGAIASAKKTWTKEGTYQVKVVAKDAHGVVSVWSNPLPITMPLSYKMPFLQLLEQLFEQFPHMFPLLRHLMGY
jgi:hypothetical protein